MSFPLVGNLSSKKDAGQSGMTDLGSLYFVLQSLQHYSSYDTVV